MRRLPIYFLVDTCLSMSGEPIGLVEKCINGAIKIMRQNPLTFEASVISIITYGNNRITLLESYKSLSEIEFQKFVCAGFSNINYGLETVKDDYNKYFIKTKTERKGDYKPMLFVFTGVAPSTKIDNTLIDFFEKNFSHGFLDYTDGFIGDFENISDKANYTFIVTSDNDFTKNSFGNYFSNVMSYEDVEGFVRKFNKFLFWNS